MLCGGSGMDRSRIGEMDQMTEGAPCLYIFGSTWKEALRVMLYAFEGDLPVGETEACVKTAYGV